MFSLICTWINGWVNNREAGDLTRFRAHYDVRVMELNWIKGQFGKTAGDVMESDFTPHRKLWVVITYPFNFMISDKLHLAGLVVNYGIFNTIVLEIP